MTQPKDAPDQALATTTSAAAPAQVPAAPARRARAGVTSRLRHRLHTLGQLLAYFAHRQRWFLLPLVLVLLLAGVLLLVTGGLAYVAPFVYSIF